MLYFSSGRQLKIIDDHNTSDKNIELGSKEKRFIDHTVLGIPQKFELLC